VDLSLAEITPHPNPPPQGGREQLAVGSCEGISYNMRHRTGGRIVANFFQRGRVPEAPAGRLPPGQYLTEKWPILHYGAAPDVPHDRWSLRVFGLIQREPFALSWSDLLALPQVGITEDIHCVTTWTRLDAQFEGVRFGEIAALAQPRPEATHVMIHGERSYTTNLPLADLMLPNVILAHRADGKDLEAEHGGPVRLVVPHLYFWKSAKWITGVEFMAGDKPGFWENFGYHMRGDPWAEERYSD
jgi:DMSO/TMAO reductase YedYZ molybdopterin-dependent catalytic subunit